MNWQRLSASIRANLESRDLKEPRLRLSALENVGRSLTELFPEFGETPEILLQHGERTVSIQLARRKETGSLNGAERSVLHQIFETLRSHHQDS